MFQQKRLLALVSLIAMALLLVSCTSAPTPTPAPAATAAPAAAATAATAATPAPATAAPAPAATPKPVEKVKLSWASWSVGPVDEKNKALDALSAAFPNIEFTLLPFERATWVEQINTRVAGGDIPDIIYRDSYGVVRTFVEQKILAEVPFELAAEAAPGIYNATKEYGKEVWLAAYVNGKNYGLPIMQPEQTRPFTDAWRMDWLQNVGITSVPTTLEEYETALTKMTNDDPDKNGKKDTYGTSFRGKDLGQYLFNTVYAAFGVIPGQPCLVNGEVMDGRVSPQAKDALTVLNRWYKAGIVDPEFVTSDNAIVKQKWANSQIGLMTFGTYYRFYPTGEFYDALIAVKPDAQVAIGPAPKGPSGDYGYMNWGSITSSICFGKQLAGTDKLKLAMQVIDKMSTDEDLYMITHYGPAETWTRDPAHNGVVRTDSWKDSATYGPLGVNFFQSVPAIPVIQDKIARKDRPELFKYAIEGTVKNGTQYFTWLGYFTDPEVGKANVAATDMLTKNTIDFITGARPLDQFDKFVEEYKAAGGKAIIDDNTRAYNAGAGQIDAIKGFIK